MKPAALSACLIVVATFDARAETVPERGRAGPSNVEIEVPDIVMLDVGYETGERDVGLDLENIVESAAKRVTTIQEAPAIITVITAREIRERSLETVEEIVDSVPGWMRLGGLHSLFSYPMTRGTVQGTLLLHNGVSLFDPSVNIPTMGRVQPVETIKRIEIVTGPGGVLWGANSFLGIVNVITKDAEDVNGVEASISWGDGPGHRDARRGYVMAGIPKLFGNDDANLFLHASFESYRGPAFEMPQNLIHSPLPQPNGPILYGPLTTADPPQSDFYVFDGKLELGELSFAFQVPFIERYTAMSFPGAVVREDLPEDELRDPATGERLCTPEEPFARPDDPCLDRGRQNRANRMDMFERYGVAEYGTRSSDGKLGADLKVYMIQFVREFPRLLSMPPALDLLEGGLNFTFSDTNYRVGAQVDSDLELPASLRVLFGAEAFREWLPDNATGSRQGPGRLGTFHTPYNLRMLPLPCPVRPAANGETELVPGCPLTAVFEADRVVLGGYSSLVWQPTRALTLQGGARLQAAPEALGSLGYDPEALFSGALVYELAKNWHVKLNYAEGFRPPVYANTNANREAVQIGGNPELSVERSQAYQTEINARLFRGERYLRELTLRADYSYSRLTDQIQIVSGSYANSGERGIQSAELLATLFLRGGHWFQLGYTWLDVATADKGAHRALPEHWFNVIGVFQLVQDKLIASGSLRVIGATEDANRLVEYRELEYDEFGRVVDDAGNQVFQWVAAHELVMDRLPPGGELSLGLAFMPTESWRLQGSLRNVLNARYYQPDAFFDYEPRLEFTPNPYEDVRFNLTATYSF